MAWIHSHSNERPARAEKSGQQLAEPDSPTPLSLCYTHVAPSMNARCRARARGLAQKGCTARGFAF